MHCSARCYSAKRPRVSPGVSAGSTEFTQEAGAHTLATLEEVAGLLAAEGKPLLVKNHCTNGQRAKGFPDPLDPRRDINFNYLPYYAKSANLVNAPHTVQFYALDDPLVGSYGRENFSDVQAFLRLFEQERRPAVFPTPATHAISTQLKAGDTELPKTH